MNNWVVENDLHRPYFQAAEEDLERLGRFIEILEGNYSTYSSECTRLLLASCSEIEVVLKLATSLGGYHYLSDWLHPLGVDAELLRSSEITVRRSGLKIQPWKGWAN